MWIRRVIQGVHRLNSHLFSVQYHKKISPQAQKYAIFSRKLRKTIDLQDVIQVIEQNIVEVQQRGKTIVLQFFNEFNMDNRGESLTQVHKKMISTISKLKNLSFYELNVKLSILEKFYSLFIVETQWLKIYITQKDQCVDQLLDYIDKHELDLYLIMNILMIFRVHRYTKLRDKALSILNDIILQYQNDLNLIKLWAIVFHQLQFIEWNELKKYSNIVIFMTDQFNLMPNTANTLEYFESVLNILHIMSTFQLHKVGLRRVPICYKNGIQVLKQNLIKMSCQNTFISMSIVSSLPPSYCPMLRKELMKKFQNFIITQRSPLFPWKTLSNEELDQYFSREQRCLSLFYEVIYQTVPENFDYFYRGTILIFLEKLINDKVSKIGKLDNRNEKSAQNVSRYCQLLYVFTRLGNSNVVTNLKKIITNQFSLIGIDGTIQTFSFSNLITLISSFEENPPVFYQVKDILQQQLQFRKTPTKIPKYTANLIIAIENHIDNGKSYIQEIIMKFMTISIQPKEKFDFSTDRKILLSIINSTQVQYYKKIKKMLFSKMDEKQLATFAQYFVLHYNQTYTGAHQLLSQMITHKVPALQLLKFLSSTGEILPRDTQTLLSKQLNKYFLFNSQSHHLSQHFENLKQVNYTLTLLINFVACAQFQKKTYFQTLNIIHSKIKSNNVDQYKISNKIIIQFIFKFQDIISPKEFIQPTGTPTLNKIYDILKIIAQRNEPYSKVKLTQFYYCYKQVLKITQGLNFNAKQLLSQCLNSKNNLQQIIQICFIFLELDCFGVLLLPKVLRQQCKGRIDQEIKKGAFTNLQKRNIPMSILVHSKIIDPPQIKIQIFRSTMSPLLLKLLQAAKNQNSFFIARYYVEYFQWMEEINKIDQFCVQMIQKQFNSAVLIFVINHYPTSRVNGQLYQAILNKVINLKGTTDKNFVKIAYFFETVYFQTPDRYIQRLKILWNQANKFMSWHISVLKKLEQENTQMRYHYLFDVYPLYLFSCIKSGNVQNNQNYTYLIYVLKKQSNLVNKLSNHFIKFINGNVLKYEMAKKMTQKSALQLFPNQEDRKIGKIFWRNYQLQQNLTKQNIEYQFNYQLDHFIVPYYIPSKKQVIILLHYKKLNDLRTTILASGIEKFQLEIWKKLLSNYTVKYYNIYGHNFID